MGYLITKKIFFFFLFIQITDFDKNKHKPQQTKQSEASNSKPKSLVDELFGRSKSEPPADNKLDFEFKLSEKYANNNSNTNKNEEDFSFGGYVPSAIRSTSQPKRNVGFTDDLFDVDIFANTRPKTAPGPSQNEAKKAEPPNLAKTISLPVKNNNNTSDDWFGLSMGSDTSKASAQNPKPANKPKQSDSEWLSNLNSKKELDKDFGSDIFASDISSSAKPKPQSQAQEKPVIEKPPLASSTKAKETPQQVKDSMNSSFADSIEDKPSALNHIQPLQFEINQVSKQAEGSAVPSEAEDGWLNNLISNKKTGKKVNVSRNEVFFLLNLLDLDC